MSKRKGLGKLFNRRGREVEEYVTSDQCKECHPEKSEEFVDEETSEVLQKFFEDNPIDLESLEKENREKRMEDLLSEAFDTSKVMGVTYYPETEEYSFMLEEGEAFLPKKLKEPKEDNREKEESINKEVVHPDHYNRTSVETMEKFFLMTDGNEDLVKGALLFNILKYTDRAGHKGDIEVDNKKAEFYLDLLNHLFPHDFDFYRNYRSFKIIR